MYFGAVIAMLLLPSVMKAQINQATQTIRGQVCDVASGEPMIGVTITVENGTTLATVSDVDGNFVINNSPPLYDVPRRKSSPTGRHGRAW